jgi:hypothetical protein
MTGTFVNTAEGGVNGNNIVTAGQPAGNGDAFSQVLGTVSYTNVSPLNGTLSYFFNAPTATTNFVAYQDSTAESDWKVRFYVRFPSYSNINHQFIDIRTTGGTLGGVTLSPTGQVRCNASATSSSFGVPVYSTATRIRVEAQGSGYGTAATSLNVQFFLDESLTPFLTTSVSGATTSAGAQVYRFGKPATSGQSTMTDYVIDNFMLITGSSSPAIGPSEVPGTASSTITADATATGTVGAVGTATGVTTAGGTATSRIGAVGSATGATTAGGTATGRVGVASSATQIVTAGLTASGRVGLSGTAVLTTTAGGTATGLVEDPSAPSTAFVAAGGASQAPYVQKGSATSLFVGSNASSVN